MSFHLDQMKNQCQSPFHNLYHTLNLSHLTKMKSIFSGEFLNESKQSFFINVLYLLQYSLFGYLC